MRNSKGFTLLEVILALSILATIGIVTINILSTQIFTRQKLEDISSLEHMLDASMNRIVADLQGAYLPDQKNSGSLNLINRPLPAQFYFRHDNLIFFTHSFHSYLRNSSQSNQAFIKYYVRSNPTDSRIKQLVRVTDTDLVNSMEKDDVGVSLVLLEDVDSFKVYFWDGDQFRSEWDSQANETINKLPKMVKIHISCYGNKNRFEDKSPDANKNKDVPTLETIVYLSGAAGQKEANTPSWSEFKWN